MNHWTRRRGAGVRVQMPYRLDHLLCAFGRRVRKHSGCPMRGTDLQVRVLSCGLSLAACLLAIGAAGLQGEETARPDPAPPAGLYVEVRLARPMKVNALKPGDIVEGTLARDVYAGDRELFPAHSTIHLSVDHLEKRKRERNDHWPGVMVLFSPRYTNYPVFRSGSVRLPTGDVPLNVSLISVRRSIEIRASGKSKNSSAPVALPRQNEDGTAVVATASPSEHAKSKERKASQTLILEAAAPDTLPALQAFDPPGVNAPDSPLTVPAGTQAQIVLLAPLSASKSRPGDVFHARVIEPVRSGHEIVLPAGSIFEGKVVKSKPPRWLSRPGSLYLAFTDLTVASGVRVPVAAQLTGAETDQRSHLRIDSEGGMSGGHPGKAWMLINLGVTAGVSKETDDAFQLLAEALVSTATDASTAGTGRIVAACASGIYMVTRHGRDVVLPRFTELNVAFSRPLSMARATAEESRPSAVPEESSARRWVFALPSSIR